MIINKNSKFIVLHPNLFLMETQHTWGIEELINNCKNKKQKKKKKNDHDYNQHNHDCKKKEDLEDIAEKEESKVRKVIKDILVQ